MARARAVESPLFGAGVDLLLQGAQYLHLDEVLQPPGGELSLNGVGEREEPETVYVVPAAVLQ